MTIIIGYFLFKWIGFITYANSMIGIIILIGVTILVIYAQRFNHNKSKKTKLTYFILGFVMIFVIGLLTYGYLPSKAIITNDTIRFTGMYGFEMNVSEIENIELTDKIPTIKMRTNGFSFGTVKKGFFHLDGLGQSRLLIHPDTTPYLIISKTTVEKQ